MGNALVARTTHLERARRAVLGGRGAVIAGEAGVGKTALAAAVVENLGTGEQPAAWIVASAAGRLIPFGALAPLLPPDLTDLHPAAILPAIARRLTRLSGPAGRRPLLVIDDAQLLDDHSAATVLALVTAGTARVLATVRTGAAASDAVRALWKDRLLDRIDLGPLDRVATRSLLAARLGADVAATAAELLWRHSRGNPLYLTELVHFGLDSGRLRRDAGVWWWRGGPDVPPRLDDLLGHRLDGLSPAAREALDVLALAEPLPYETVAAVVPPGAIADLDEQGLLASDEHDGVVWLRIDQPLMQAVARHRLNPARRRRLAGRLRHAPADQVPAVRRAVWEEAAGTDQPDVDLLLAAANGLQLSEPRMAVRLAAKATRHDTGPRSALVLSAANAELGELGAARAALATATERVSADSDRLTVGFEDISLSMWSERDPIAALSTLDRMRAGLPAGYGAELESATALLMLFTARPAAALRAADAVLAGEPGHDAAVRAQTVRLAALTLADQPAEAMEASARLVAALKGERIAPYRSALAHAMLALAHQFCAGQTELPRAFGLSGRWPADPFDTDPTGPTWPLLEGVQRHLEGNLPLALAALREAYVQQSTGEGLFRSEAVGGLIVVLAESGRVDEATQLLAEHPPDGVAVIPGMRGWAEAAVAAAAGSPDAGKLALDVARQTLEAGAVTTALWYLADAARHGAAGAALAEVEALPRLPRSDIAQARVAGIAARAAGTADLLLEAAQRHATLGLFGHAAELARQASARAGSGRAATARATLAAQVLRRAGVGLGAAPPPAPATDAGLTPREAEIARMAAAGSTDREISATLVVSVRTVESHLGSVYRKLGIRSRRGLGAALIGNALGA